MYNSLGVCAEVANVTDVLKVTNVSFTVTNEYESETNVSLPNGVYLMAGTTSLNNTTPTSVAKGLYVGLTNHSLYFAGEPFIKNTAISNFFIIYTKNTTGTSYIGSPYGALEVVFLWCVNSYSTKVFNGVPTTITPDISINVRTTNGSLTTIEAFTNQDGNDTTIYSNYTSYDNLFTSTQNDSTNYAVDGATNGALQTYLAGVFSGINSVGSSGVFSTNAAMAFSNALYSQVYYRGTSVEGVDQVQIDGVANLTNNIATSMTNSIRITPYRGDAATGIAYVEQSYVKVRWAWLSYLFALLILSFAFLLATIFKSRAAEIDILKSSSLATLAALSPEGKSYMGAIETRGRSSEKAENLSVRLSKRDGAWSLDLTS